MYKHDPSGKKGADGKLYTFNPNARRDATGNVYVRLKKAIVGADGRIYTVNNHAIEHMGNVYVPSQHPTNVQTV